MNLRRCIEISLSKIHTILLCCCSKRIKIGKGTNIYYRTPIINMSKAGIIEIGKSCSIGTSRYGYHGGMPFYATILNDGNNSDVYIGNNCRIHAYIHAQKRIEIGNDCVIAAGVSIMDSNGHEVISSNRTKGRDIPQSIKIGNNVWVGLNSIILKNTIIGDNSIVAAGSIVKGVFPNNSLIAGNPAEIKGSIKIK